MEWHRVIQTLDGKNKRKKKKFFILKVWGTVVAIVSGLTPHKNKRVSCKATYQNNDNSLICINQYLLC